MHKKISTEFVNDLVINKYNYSKAKFDWGHYEALGLLLFPFCGN